MKEISYSPFRLADFRLIGDDGYIFENVAHLDSPIFDERIISGMLRKNPRVEYSGYGRCEETVEAGDTFRFKEARFIVQHVSVERGFFDGRMAITERLHIQAVAYPPIE